MMDVISETIFSVFFSIVFDIFIQSLNAQIIATV